MLNPRDALAASKQSALAVAEGAGKEKVIAALQQAAEELAGRLDALPPGQAGSFTHAQMAATLKQVQAVVQKLVIPGLKAGVVEAGGKASEYAAGHTLDYLAAQHQAYKGTLGEPLALDEAFVFDRARSGTESSILHRLSAGPTPDKPGILARYGMETVGHFEDVLKTGMITKRSWEDTKDMLVQQSPFLQAAPRFWAERIVRTESMNASNLSALNASKAANEQLGDMCKILSATFDGRTGSDSYCQHGQIRRMEEAFESWFGAYQHPPNRPNDREIVVPHRISWPIPPYLMQRSDAEVLERWKVHEKRKGACPPRPLMTTIPLDQFGKEQPDSPDAENDKPKELQGPLDQPRPLGAELGAEDAAAKAETFRGIPLRSTWSPAEKQARAKQKAVAAAKDALGYMPASEEGAGWVSHDLPTYEPSSLYADLTPDEKKIVGDVLDGKLPALLNESKLGIDDLHLIPTSKDIKKDYLEKLIDKGGTENESALVVKKGGKYHVEMGSPDIVADELLGKGSIDADLLDLDDPATMSAITGKAKKYAAGKKASATKAANKAKKIAEAAAELPAVDVAPAALSPDEIMAKKVGEQKGSNAGGFYEGADGVKRYVKEYSDPGQAHGEQVSNAVYRALGFGAPESQVFEKGGKLHYASKVIDGKTLSEVGLNKENAGKILDGFAADVLLVNWDVVGMSKDNVIVDAAGGVHRIDNGGALLMRAKNGRKLSSDLHSLSEWDNFFNYKNPSYAEVAKKAGVESAEDMEGKVKKGIEDILALRKKSGGWDKFVEQSAPGFAGKDRDAVVQMLSKRSDLLEQKLADLNKPKPKLELQVTPAGKMAPPKIEPGMLAKGPAVEQTKNETPDGVSLSTYRSQMSKGLKDVPVSSQSAIRRFTGSNYGSIREAMSAGEGSHYEAGTSKAIREVFDHAIPTPPGVVYRGIGVPKEGIDYFCALDEDKPINLGPWKGNPACASASRSVSAAKRFAQSNGPEPIMLVIKQTRGVAIEQLSGIPGENEILMHPDAHFKVTKRHFSDVQGKTMLTLHLDELTAEEIAGERAKGVLPPSIYPAKP